jgi:hypothetical protein
VGSGEEGLVPGERHFRHKAERPFTRERRAPLIILPSETGPQTGVPLHVPEHQGWCHQAARVGVGAEASTVWNGPRPEPGHRGDWDEGRPATGAGRGEGE